ncbi:MAG: hypothetical protein HQ568_03900 [Calditrichaeota bacterium]|nr:hypothetical protein [Calditrichota bacterium]
MTRITVAEKDDIELDTPSPALGKAVATTIHQTVTDPYFKPLEELADYLTQHPECDMISIEQMSKWSIDDELPTCFVWDTDGSNFKLSHGASPWALEMVTEKLRECVLRENPRGLLFINTFRANGENYWLGFMKVPKRADSPTQMAGVFFSMDRYLDTFVPRLIDEMSTRQRFPIVSFQLNDPPMHGEDDGDIAFRILDKRGNTYLQRGRTFAEDKMIYSESKWFPRPIVAMQEGWDLQIFSANAVPQQDDDKDNKMRDGMFIVLLVIVSLLYWWGGKSVKV